MIEENKLIVVEKKGKGAKKFKESQVVVKEDQQYKFFVDLRYEKEILETILKLLKEANNKSYGREITFKDLAIYGIPKLNSKDLEKIQEQSLTDMERVQKLLDEHNAKSGAKLSLGEFLVKKLNI